MRFKAWLLTLLVLSSFGWGAYAVQLSMGLTVTGMGREVPWGLYIANFTFLVGIAASAIVVVLPLYVYSYERFKNLTVVGEVLAISAITMSFLFILVDLGRPDRVLNVIKYPSPNSLMFYDLIVLSVYFILNMVILLGIQADKIRKNSLYRLTVLVSIPWAISIHTITAFIYSGLIARSFWNVSILAPRFLASAFASGSAFIIITALILRRRTGFNITPDSVFKLSEIAAFAMVANIFFFASEVFTVFYGAITEHKDHYMYLFFQGGGLTLLFWISLILGIGSVILLLYPPTRKNELILMFASLLILISIWIEKGINLIVPAFIPSSAGTVATYWPTPYEILITAGVWSTGLLILSFLLRKLVGAQSVVDGYKSELSI